MSRRALPALRALSVLALAALVAAGCTRGSTSSRPPIHLNPNMDDQPKYRAQAESDFFYDGAAMRPPIAGTVARGELALGGSFASGRDEGGFFIASPVEADERVLTRGEERYGIFCTPCHGDNGSSKGVLFERSGIESADLRDPRLVSMSDGEIFETLTHGLGLMPGYAYQIPAADRWAIIAHVRRLQQEAP